MRDFFGLILMHLEVYVILESKIRLPKDTFILNNNLAVQTSRNSHFSK